MDFRIEDPYAVPGEYRKTQLHCHTTASDGRFAPRELLRMYKDAGYAFVFLTDHNRVTRCDELNDETFLALPGTEDTVSRLRPLGPHLLRLLVPDPYRGGDPQRCIDRTRAVGGLTGLCHPSWTGNLWTGAWSRAALARLAGFTFVEIWNPHSDSSEDLRRWDAAQRAGAQELVWGIAVDDCHVRSQFNRGWIEAKVPGITREGLEGALRRGAFFASTGPAAEFGAAGDTVVARFEERMAVRFVDARGAVRQQVDGTEVRYTAGGDERHLRVEARRGSFAVWSQPFRVRPAAEDRLRG